MGLRRGLSVFILKLSTIHLPGLFWLSFKCRGATLLIMFQISLLWPILLISSSAIKALMLSVSSKNDVVGTTIISVETITLISRRDN